MPELIFYQKGEPLLRFPVRTSATRIGRSPECEITLMGDTLSRVQCILYESEQAYLLKNIGKARAFLQGQAFDSTPLKDGDRIFLEDWEILFSEETLPWNEQETYISQAGGES